VLLLLLLLLQQCGDQDILTVGMLVTAVKVFQHLLVPLRKATTYLKSETAV
jgi:hypothetical protein